MPDPHKLEQAIENRKYVPHRGKSDEGFDPKQIELFGARVLIQRDVPKEKTDGGLYVPDTAQRMKHTGRVLAIGPTVGAVEPGDRVMFGKYAGVEAVINGVEIVICLQDDLVARLSDELLETDRPD